VRFHDLRHASATLTLAAGVHRNVAAERLGHADVRMTLNVYTHVIAGLDDDTARRVDLAMQAPERKISGNVRSHTKLPSGAPLAAGSHTKR
jgi:hypothetical protein